MAGPLVLRASPPHWDSYVGLGGPERGASGNAGGAKMRKGFLPSWQRLSHHSPTPWRTRPGLGLVEPQVTKFRAYHICCLSSELPLPQRLPRSWALAGDLIPGLQRSRPLRLPSRRAAVLSQSDAPGTAVSGLSGPNTCRACSGPQRPRQC